MNKKTILIILILAAIGLLYLLWPSPDNENKEQNLEEQDLAVCSVDAEEPECVGEETPEQANGFKSLSSAELETMLTQKDFKLIDVHIPEQRHIPETDYFIPYNEIDKITSVLADKNEPVVLYCRSGNMSKTVAQELINQGYTNVTDLTNGLNEWIAQGKETLPQNSLYE